MENKIVDIIMKYNSSLNNCVYYSSYEKIAKEISIELKLLTATLEAKIYAYEKIIANSNFKVMLKEKSKGE